MLKRFEHGGNIYAAPPPGKAWLDFSANINPLGLSPDVRDAMTAHIDAVVHYPDPKGTALREALERTYGVSKILSSWEMGQPNSFISICIRFGPGGS